MTWKVRTWTTLAAASGFVSVAAGAFAAHGAGPRAAELLRTGALYGMTHALATLACAALVLNGVRRARVAPALFLPGILLFSGSLFAMAFGAPVLLGAITPIGGLLFLIGWAALAWASWGIGR